MFYVACPITFARTCFGSYSFLKTRNMAVNLLDLLGVNELNIISEKTGKVEGYVDRKDVVL